MHCTYSRFQHLHQIHIHLETEQILLDVYLSQLGPRVDSTADGDQQGNGDLLLLGVVEILYDRQCSFRGVIGKHATVNVVLKLGEVKWCSRSVPADLPDQFYNKGRNQKSDCKLVNYGDVLTNGGLVAHSVWLVRFDRTSLQCKMHQESTVSYQPSRLVIKLITQCLTQVKCYSITQVYDIVASHDTHMLLS